MDVVRSLAVSGTGGAWLTEVPSETFTTLDTPISITTEFTTFTVTGMVTEVLELTAVTVIVPLQVVGMVMPVMVAVTTINPPFWPTLGAVVPLAGLSLRKLPQFDDIAEALN